MQSDLALELGHNVRAEVRKVSQVARSVVLSQGTRSDETQRDLDLLPSLLTKPVSRQLVGGRRPMLELDARTSDNGAHVENCVKKVIRPPYRTSSHWLASFHRTWPVTADNCEYHATPTPSFQQLWDMLSGSYHLMTNLSETQF